MYENLEGFGEDHAVDGKYLDTYANQFHKSKFNKISRNKNVIIWKKCLKKWYK